MIFFAHKKKAIEHESHTKIKLPYAEIYET